MTRTALHRAASQKGRRGCAVLAAASAVFAVYISLVPFDFRTLSAADAGAALLAALDVAAFSLSNFVANVLLFIGFGFFGAGALRRGSARMARAAAVLGAAFVVSVASEALQILVLGRTPSILDVVAQLAGAVVGLMAWSALEEVASRWLGKIGHRANTSILQRVLFAYAACRAIVLLLPLDVTVSRSTLAAKHRSGGIRLVPFGDLSDLASLAQSFSIDMTLALPIGALAVTACTGPGERRSLARGIALATAFSACLEVAQIIVVSRVADATQIVSGAMGAAIGAFVSTRFTAARREVLSVKSAPSPWALLRLTLSPAAYLVYNWSPFDFAASESVLRRGLAVFLQVPFQAYYENPGSRLLRTS